MKKVFVFIVFSALLLSACSTPVVTPSPTPIPVPTPQVIVKTVEVPGPTVYRVPQICFDAIDSLVAALDSENTLLGFYLDGKEPTEEAFKQFIDGEEPASVFNKVKECWGYKINGVNN